MQFRNALELRNYIMPVLKIRTKELRKQNITMTEEELFNYFVKIWKNESNLTLADVVDDVLNRKVGE